MLVTRISNLTGKLHKREINVTEAQIHAWRHGALIQEAMPHLGDEDREYLQTGITPEEWREYIGDR